ncbi:MAG: GTP pyrophosphokinase family protein [Spirochaetaceae bacterium]|nr:MAG: GTP pyrophosphokinase family protein [Spirochaetaceae bacterium]
MNNNPAVVSLALDDPTAGRATLTRFMNRYRFALQEIATRIDILKQEFETTHEYSPIEHVSQRIKTPESIISKARRLGVDLSLDAIREQVRDIAGIRITCSFTSDVFRVASMLVQQPDLTVVEYKDYIEEPKPSGYRSLHLIVEVPVYTSDRGDRVCVEVQIRTIAMDFWASLEHKIYYKYRREVPQRLRDDLLEVSEDIKRLDAKMERLHREMQQRKVDDFE